MSNPLAAYAVLTICGTSSALLLQAPIPTDTLTQIEHITLVGALIVAVIVLWKTVGRKDAQVNKAVEQMAAALTSTAMSAQELRKIVEQSVDANHKLGMAIEELGIRVGQLPCVAPDPKRNFGG
jgi:N-glycosylase/DNA lyase